MSGTIQPAQSLQNSSGHRTACRKPDTISAPEPGFRLGLSAFPAGFCHSSRSGFFHSSHSPFPRPLFFFYIFSAYFSSFIFSPFIFLHLFFFFYFFLRLFTFSFPLYFCFSFLSSVFTFLSSVFLLDKVNYIVYNAPNRYLTLSIIRCSTYHFIYCQGGGRFEPYAFCLFAFP